MRLVTFLGTGRYERTVYTDPQANGVETQYVAHAIARLWDVREVIVLATKEAELKHGAGLCDALGDHLEPDIRSIPAGRTETELWEQFEILRKALECDTPLILDITHGFRSQPFFAAGAVAYLRNAGALQGRETRIVYGRFLPDEPKESPIWDLTPFMDLLDWAQGAAVLVQTGHAGPFVEVARRADKSLRKRLSAESPGKFPPTGKLVTALETFADDLSTVRIAALTTGYAQDHRGKVSVEGSASRVLAALDEYMRHFATSLPALGPVLNRVRDVAEGLATDTLSGKQGQGAMAVLARRYLDYERYPEAMIVLREALVSRSAKDDAAAEVNSPQFDYELRKRADADWGKCGPSARDIGNVRNDILHGGFNSQPQSARSLKENVRKLIEHHLPLELDGSVLADCPGPNASEGKTYFVTRHPGARDWAAQEGIAVDELVDHLEVERVQPGDRVLGSLPVNLAAEVCARGGRYLHLSLELAPGLRGRELTAADMRLCGARLEEFWVEKVVP